MYQNGNESPHLFESLKPLREVNAPSVTFKKGLSRVQEGTHLSLQRFLICITRETNLWSVSLYLRADNSKHYAGFIGSDGSFVSREVLYRRESIRDQIKIHLYWYAPLTLVLHRYLLQY